LKGKKIEVERKSEKFPFVRKRRPSKIDFLRTRLDIEIPNVNKTCVRKAAFSFTPTFGPLFFLWGLFTPGDFGVNEGHLHQSGLSFFSENESVSFTCLNSSRTVANNVFCWTITPLFGV
jgi:hypothetical protein